MAEELIDIQSLTVGYNTQPILENVNLKVFPLDFIGVIGPNGGGKTTLIKSILGELPHWKGKVDYSIDHSQIGYLPQINDFDKAFPISVIEVVMSGMLGMKKLFAKYSNKDREKAIALLEKAGIEHLKDVSIGNLSGGQVQRVLLCRALVNQPQLLVLDEPGNFVDNRFEHELFNWLEELNNEIAIIMVSHDLGTISSHVKTIACVNKSLHYHQSNKISEEQLASYNCPIQLITHGEVPHRVLKKH
jgi:zinc transport system ATP-binding protein